jgi:hypothetical protein
MRCTPLVDARTAPPSTPAANGPPPAAPSSGAPSALGSSAPGAPGGKSKECQRCQKVKAAAKVTIQTTVVKLCQPCADLVSSNDNLARETLRAITNSAGPSGPPPNCEQCNLRPGHARTVLNGAAKTLCAACMADTPHFQQMTRFAIACVAGKKIDEAKQAFEEW